MNNINFKILLFKLLSIIPMHYHSKVAQKYINAFFEIPFRVFEIHF